MKRQVLNGLMLVAMATGPMPVPGCPSRDCPRVPALKPDDQGYARFEGTGFENRCTTDGDCAVGGCGGEVCAAEPVVSICDLMAQRPRGECGCVDGSCTWFIEECPARPLSAASDDAGTSADRARSGADVFTAAVCDGAAVPSRHEENLWRRSRS